MFKKLYGLFIYKLQYTSFFSIMQRLSGFILIFSLYYFFLQEVITSKFNYNNNSFFRLIFFSLLILFLYYFIFHILVGLRIYLISLYYKYNLNKKLLNLNLIYSIKLIEKNRIYKYIINSISFVRIEFQNFLIRSNSFFLLFVFNCFIFFLIFLLL
jgi:succinate dehydrogenase/fumarate reductase cytochrome b subunit